MRRLMMAAAAIGALVGAGSLAASSAQALPGAAGLSGTNDLGQVEKVQLVCPRPFWNGWRWVQPPCRPAYAPRYYSPYADTGPPPLLYAQPQVIVRPYRPRPYWAY